MPTKGSLWGLGLGLILVTPAAAQVTTNTTCSQYGWTLSCNSYSRSRPLIIQQQNGPNAWENLAQGLALARALRREPSEGGDRAQEHKELEATRGAARRLYLERVGLVIKELGDSLRIFGEMGTRFLDKAQPSLADLFLVHPDASRQDILETLAPHVRWLNQEFLTFIERMVPPVKPAVDSLSLSREEAPLFINTFAAVSQDIFMAQPDATSEQYRAAIQPLLDRARIFFDSTRAVNRP